MENFTWWWKNKTYVVGCRVPYDDDSMYGMWPIKYVIILYHQAFRDCQYGQSSVSSKQISILTNWSCCSNVWMPDKTVILHKVRNGSVHMRFYEIVLSNQRLLFCAHTTESQQWLYWQPNEYLLDGSLGLVIFSSTEQENKIKNQNSGQKRTRDLEKDGKEEFQIRTRTARN